MMSQRKIWVGASIHFYLLGTLLPTHPPRKRGKWTIVVGIVLSRGAVNMLTEVSFLNCC
jgi:hypothetical protein